jgi:DNA-binding IclR family transcriptional regulator
MALLKAFDDTRPSWGLSDLAREAGLNKTTAFRLLSALESEGMIARGQDGERYVLGPEVVVMGGRALRANNLRAIARPELETLAQQTGETAALEVRSGREMLVIDEVIGEYLMSGVQSIGSRWPLHATSTGLAILAFMPEQERDSLLMLPLAAVTEKTITDPVMIRQELEQVRGCGYAVAAESLEEGLVAIGAPLYNHDGDVPGAISVAIPKLRLSEDRVAEIGVRLVEAAGRISARLGYRPRSRNGEITDSSGYIVWERSHIELCV